VITLWARRKQVILLTSSLNLYGTLVKTESKVNVVEKATFFKKTHALVMFMLHKMAALHFITYATLLSISVVI
jgi:hypothetical protein